MFAYNKNFKFDILVLLVLIGAYLTFEANSAPIVKKRALFSSTNNLEKKNYNNLHSKTYEDLINEIRLQLLANMLNSKNQNDNLNESDLDDNNDDSVDSLEASDEEGSLQKRSRNFRHGETRSRVKLLHQQNLNHHNRFDGSDNSSQLRKAWEKNLYEKDRMYQNLLGGR